LYSAISNYKNNRAIINDIRGDFIEPCSHINRLRANSFFITKTALAIPKRIRNFHKKIVKDKKYNAAILLPKKT
jgi:hypothetical protein